MLINKDVKLIEGVPPKNPENKSLGAIYFDKDAQRLVGTDQHCLVVHPVDVHEDDESCLIPVEAVHEARRIFQRHKVGRGTPLRTANGKIRVLDEFDGTEKTFARLPEGEFPDYRKLFRSIETVPTLAIDMNVLLKLAKAITDQVDGKLALNLWLNSPVPTLAGICRLLEAWAANHDDAKNKRAIAAVIGKLAELAEVLQEEEPSLQVKTSITVMGSDPEGPFGLIMPLSSHHTRFNAGMPPRNGEDEEGLSGVPIKATAEASATEKAVA